MVVSSLDFEESLDFHDFSAYPRASSLRFNPESIKSAAKVGPCSSSRFSFTVSHHFDSLKPWYLSLTDSSASKVGPTSPSRLGPALISPLNARSFSFASPAARTPRGGTIGPRKSLFPSTPLPQRTCEQVKVAQPRTPRPSFLQSPAMFFQRKECHVSRAEKSRESFVPYLKFYRRPYDEMIYRSKMRPPLGGLISIVSPHLKRRHMSVSQRFWGENRARKAKRAKKRRLANEISRIGSIYVFWQFEYQCEASKNNWLKIVLWLIRVSSCVWSGRPRKNGRTRRL